MDKKELADIREITDVIYRYARGVDRRDLELVRACFHPDAYDDHGAISGNVDELLRQIEAFVSRYDLTYHFIGNVLVEVFGDVARAESYAIAVHRREPVAGREGKHDTWGIRYVDRFERRGGEWRIAYRVVAREWRTVLKLPESDIGRGSFVPRSREGGAEPLEWILERRSPGR